jgi:hypothetical protein
METKVNWTEKIIDWGIANLLYYSDDEMVHMEESRRIIWMCQLRRGGLLARGIFDGIAVALHGINVIIEGIGPEELKLRSVHQFDTATLASFDDSMQELRMKLSGLRKRIHRSLLPRGLHYHYYSTDKK